jgi:glutamate racemase
VLATAGTIASGAYARAVQTMSTRAEVFGQAAPLLVPLAEEGWTEGDVPHLVVRRYLEPLARANVDVIVLGCTHYPLLAPIIEAEAKAMIGESVRIVDSARWAAHDVQAFLAARGLAAQDGKRGELRLLVTDVPARFGDLARRFLGEDPPEVEQVDL